MLDSALCQQASSTRLWSMLTWRVTHVFSFVFSHPLLVVLALVAIAGLPWIVRQARWQKPALMLSGSLLVIYLTAASPILMGLGNKLLVGFVPPDSGEKAAAIVVLGRGSEQNPMRVREAAKLWNNQRAPLIFASGRGDAPRIADLLQQQQVPSEAIAGEPCSLTTDQNAEFTAAILRPQGIDKIILVTDPLHMMRSLLTFESFGFEVIPHISPVAESTQRIQRQFLVFRESLGLVSYGLLGRYSARKVPPVSVIYADSRHLPAQQPNRASIEPENIAGHL